MPRVHGMDADQRRRPHRGGIFSLSTPFQRSAVAASSPRQHRNHGNRTTAAAAEENDLDDMEFRGTQTQDLMTSTARGLSAASFSNHQHHNGDGAVTTGNSTTAMTTFHSTDAATASKSSNGPPRDGHAAAVSSSSTTTKFTHENDQQQQEQEFKDGMEEEEEDSDATMLEDDEEDGSVDLLADGNRDASHSNAVNAAALSAFSPISPATQTLDRLSKFGSQEGGAELCIHLLATAAENHGKSSDDDEEKEGRSAGKELSKTKDGESENDEEDSQHQNSAAPSSTQQNINNKEAQSVSTNLQKHQCLHDLKEYFMSTNNSSTFALKQSDLEPPTVPFCHKCNQLNNCTLSQSSVSFPHHGLCPQHPEFYESGSYEILNLIVDGNILECDACVYQFDKGRPNKKLVHGSGCKRGKKGGAGKKKKASNGSVGAKQQGQKKKSDGGTNQKQSVQLSSMQRKSAGTSTRPSTHRTPPPMMQQCQQKSPAASISSSQHSLKKQGPFEVGTIVFVQDRQWPGRNDPGGVARIIKVHPGAKSKTTYDVKYVIEARKEKGVQDRFVSLHSDYFSPSNDLSGFACDDEEVCSGESGLAKDNGSANIQVAAADGNNGNQAANEQEVDENGHPLSEYERLRLRNIKRNQARLSKLGLLAPSKSSNNDNGQSSSKRGKAKKARGKKPKQLGQETERRTQPKRQKTKHIAEGDDGKPKASIAVTDSDGNEKSGPTSSEGASLADAAKSGCKRCNAELQTGEKRKTNHDLNCPRRGAANRQKDESRPEGLHQPMIQEEDDSHDHSNGQQKQPTMLSANDGIHGGIKEQRKQPIALPASKEVSSLMDAAKAGCRKCTLEWQTEEIDPTKDHGICCPRASSAPIESRPGSQIRLEKNQPSRRKESSNTPNNRASSSNSREAEQKTSSTKATKTPKAKSRVQPTPSPVLAQKNSPEQPPPPPLPTWIKEFISEANRHNETVPAPRGSKWLPCPNPWGKIGHEEGDFVIISPFQSELSSSDIMLSIFHQGLNGGIPKRFVANPFEEGSPYHATHRSPARGGYSVLRVMRDRMSLRPWGFTVRLHEFGGACLVDSIEPLSPAEAAEDISGWSNEGSSSGLKLHDMIICINGKSVGSMNMPELQIELDVCGPELMLVVSRFDIQETYVNQDSTTLKDLAMDWNDIGAGASLKRKRVSFEDDHTDRDLYELKGQSDLQNNETEEFELDDATINEHNASAADVGHVIEQNELQPPAEGGKFNASMEQSLKQVAPSAPKHQTLLSKDAKPGHKPSLSLSKAAESGCGKCQRELRTGSKDSTHHVANCPRKGGPQASSKGNGGKDKRLSKSEKGRDSDSQLEKSEKGRGSDTHHEKKNSRPTVEKHRPLDQVQHDMDTLNASETNHKGKRGPKAVSRYQKQLEEQSDDESEILPKKAPNKKSKTNRPSKDQVGDDSSSSGVEEEYEGGDENPWLGCVCGKTHPHPIKVFWIQCEGCDAWYNVARECVGFDAGAAEEPEEWCCWACDPPVAGLGL